jgi:hypothetical protein
LSRVARREADNLAESARAQAGTDPALELHVGLTRPATERVRKTGQMRLLHHFTVLAMATMTLIATAGGCTHIAEAIDCDEMCREVQDCVDSDLDVHRCAERCEDKVDDSPLARQLDACTDCLEGDYACGEVAEQCPMCQSVSEAIIE